ncbi:MAG TPA: dihydropteroate synthase [Solirubrobacteraceae bacterium]|nr:dihydropteroate synthase [Solirubrobacteraceae bacterium]
MDRSYRLMGVLNVTPDSFSDGGRFVEAAAAVTRARELLAEGADIVDVGGESTRPGAEPVGADAELARIAPVLEGIAQAGLPARAQISIDTCKAAVARAALAAGASLVNDVSALRADPEMVGVVVQSGADCCLMHMRGQPRTMQQASAGGAGGPEYDDVVDDVRSFLEERLGFAVGEGVSEQRILLDPGIGFGKTAAHNLELLRRLDELAAIGRPLVIGTSRKSFLGRIIGESAGSERPVDTDERLPGTIATNVLALERGASVFRVHDVGAVRGALAVAAATLGGRWPTRGTQTS